MKRVTVYCNERGKANFIHYYVVGGGRIF